MQLRRSARLASKNQEPITKVKTETKVNSESKVNTETKVKTETKVNSETKTKVKTETKTKVKTESKVKKTQNNIMMVIDDTDNTIITITEDNADKYHMRVGDIVTIHSATDIDNICGTVTVVGNDGLKYEGQMLNGWYHGKGVLRTIYGNVYAGDFVNGYMHGNGKLVYSNGQIYEGEFVNDTIHGNGIMTYPMDQLEEVRCPTYIGEYQNGVAHGDGVYDWGTRRECYKGQFKNGAFHGKGTLLKDIGKDLIGTFKNDMYVGK